MTLRLVGGLPTRTIRMRSRVSISSSDMEPARLGQLIQDEAPLDFFVLVDPDNFLVQISMGRAGGFLGGPLEAGDDTPGNLMFLPNPNLRPIGVTPFHLRITQHYRAEYNLELLRHQAFSLHPSRLHALFLFDCREDAERYRELHPKHVGGRVLKRGVSAGRYKYSAHDGAWIDFLRIGHSVDEDTMEGCGRGYWLGRKADEVEFHSMGKPWEAQSFREILFYGRINFPNRDPSVAD